MPTILDRAFNALFAKQIESRVALAVRALDDATDRQWSSGTVSPRDRYQWNREDVLLDALAAWRENPLARRIVALTTDFVIGSGFDIQSPDETANQFLRAWWDDDLNQMFLRCYEWCDELTRSGELFAVVSTDTAGMSYLRAIPASEIAEITHAANDIEQETAFLQKPEDNSLLDGKLWSAYNHRTDARNENGTFADVMLHFSINKPVGAQRGESDLAPIVKWLNRYAAWLEDRVRLNHFRQSFLYVVYRKFRDASEKLAEQMRLNANPPKPGSILLADMDVEKWDVIHPKLDSFEAERDGLALKKIIAVGAGIPLHFLAEPESATRTTAEQSDDPSHRHYERRQLFFRECIVRLARIATRRRAMTDSRINANAEIVVQVPDIFARDNGQLATAAQTIVGAFVQLYDRQLITAEELDRLAYRFAGEITDVKPILDAAKKEKHAEKPQEQPSHDNTNA